MSAPGMSADAWRRYKALVVIRAQIRWYAKRRREATHLLYKEDAQMHLVGMLRGYVSMALLMGAITDREESRFIARIGRISKATVKRIKSPTVAEVPA